MLPLTIELSRSTGPDTSNDSSRVEQEAEDRLELDPRDCAPMQKCSPKPNARCGFGRRSTRNANGIVEHLLVAVRRREVQRHLLPRADRARRAPSQSSVAVRVKWLIGRDPAEDLLDRVGQQLRAGPAASPTRRGARRTRAGRR